MGVKNNNKIKYLYSYSLYSFSKKVKVPNFSKDNIILKYTSISKYKFKTDGFTFFRNGSNINRGEFISYLNDEKLGRKISHPQYVYKQYIPELNMDLKSYYSITHSSHTESENILVFNDTYVNTTQFIIENTNSNLFIKRGIIDYSNILEKIKNDSLIVQKISSDNYNNLCIYVQSVYEHVNLCDMNPCSACVLIYNTHPGVKLTVDVTKTIYMF